MLTPQILSVETALPKHALSQNEIGKMMVERLSLSPEDSVKLEKLYQNTAIEKRYTVLDHFHSEKVDSLFGDHHPKMAERNALYKQHALPLAQEAAEKALQAWGGDRSSITHILSVSCTGIFAPGLEFSLIEKLSLSPFTERLGINMMGCFGAYRALATASALAQQNPRHRILIVCTELCTLHFMPTDDWNHLIANALFADGSAAAVIGTGEKKRSFEIVNSAAFALQNSFDEMQWEAGDAGLLMKLSAKVPICIKKDIADFSKHLLQDHATAEECDWPLHPGGKAIIQVIEKKLSLHPDQTKNAWRILKNCGNMSSATFLFVLHDLMQEKKRRPFAASFGFGPGLSLEGILLRQ